VHVIDKAIYFSSSLRVIFFSEVPSSVYLYPDPYFILPLASLSNSIGIEIIVSSILALLAGEGSKRYASLAASHPSCDYTPCPQTILSSLSVQQS
jgi:hypothetical protein